MGKSRLQDDYMSKNIVVIEVEAGAHCHASGYRVLAFDHSGLAFKGHLCGFWTGVLLPDF